MSDLLLMNIPYNASDLEIREWIESRGVGTKSIRVIRDMVSGASPAFGRVELKGGIELKEAIAVLHGKRMRKQTVVAKACPADVPETRAS